MSTKIVQDSSLTSVANAIRAKGNTQATLEFPNGFISAIQNIPTGSALKHGVFFPDAELAQIYKYDNMIVADENIEIPEYSTTSQTLKASEILSPEYTTDNVNYKYLVIERCLTIPTYNTIAVGRGRVEYSVSIGAWELISIDANIFKTLIDNSKAYSSRNYSFVSAGGNFYRSLYWSSATTVSIYTSTAYGIWQVLVAPTYTNGNICINSPTFQYRTQANVFSQEFFETMTDIRFQYICEIWRVPIKDSLDDGWTANQQILSVLDNVYNNNQTLE